ncbi:hypothetical protein [Thauera humireducens]|uniref:hypothetical protein n=1 Tax=Thauera humireducens TaxID=1134435 RepID=UPI00311DD293
MHELLATVGGVVEADLSRHVGLGREVAQVEVDAASIRALNGSARVVLEAHHAIADARMGEQEMGSAPDAFAASAGGLA